METLITHITFNLTPGSDTSEDTNQIMEIDAYVILFSPNPDPRQAKNILSDHSTKITIFPDSGIKHRVNMGLTMNNFIPSRKIVRVVGGFTFVCQGWLLVKFVIQRKQQNRPFTYAKDIQQPYFSKAAWIDVGILPEDFPNTAAILSTQANIAMQFIPSRGIHQELNANTKPNEVGINC